MQWTLWQLQNQWWASKAQQMQSYADKRDIHILLQCKMKAIYGPRSLSFCPLRTADELALSKDQAGIVQRWGSIFKPY